MSGYKGNVKNHVDSGRRTGNIVQNIPAKQTVGKSQMGTSSRINFACGSGAGITKSMYPTGSSAPADSQKIRPSNKIDPTPNYGK